MVTLVTDQPLAVEVPAHNVTPLKPYNVEFTRPSTGQRIRSYTHYGVDWVHVYGKILGMFPDAQVLTIHPQ